MGPHTMLRRAFQTLAAVTALVTLWPSGPALTQPDDTVPVLVTLREQAVAPQVVAQPLVEADALDAAAQDEARSARAVRMLQRAAQVAARSQLAVRQHVAALGGEVTYAARAVNAVAARVPRGAIDTLRARPDVLAVEIDVPREAHLHRMAAATLANTFWFNGVTGGAVDVAVIDTGVFPDHETFVAKKAQILGGVFHRSARTYPSYSDDWADGDDYQGHGTLVAGMVFGQGSAMNAGRKGLAYGLDKLYNLKAGFRTTSAGGSSLLSDLMEAVDWALAQPDPPEVLNYSYGATASADDDSYARYWDAVVDAFGVTATISAGNSGSNGYTVNSPGTAHNVISVANTTVEGVVASSSSRGPTIGGRKKPDLAAPGTSIWLPSTFGETQWNAVTGTSFSAPAIAGAVALLVQTGVTDPRTVKAVLINSSDERGAAGWDAAYGWGAYNGERAWAERGQWRLDSYTAPGTAGGRRLFARDSAAGTRVTLAWHRHVAYSATSVATSGVLNDLDLRLYSADTGDLRAASTSSIDNVERVATSLSEPAVVVVETVGNVSGGSELAALAHSGGFEVRNGPGLQVAITAPATVNPGTSFTVSAAIGNPGDLRGHDYQATLVVPTGFTIESPGTSQSLDSVGAGQQGTLAWTVRAPSATTSAQSLRVDVSTTSYGVSASASASGSVAVSLTCTYAVTPPGAIPSVGGSAVVGVSAPAGCGWSASSGAAWLSVMSGATGSGTGQVQLSALANQSADARVGTLTVAGQSVAVTQQGQQAAVPPRTYYLAEGATGDLFDLDVLIANPNATDAPVVLQFMRDDGQVVTRNETVAARSRRTVHVNAVAGLEACAVSTMVTSPTGLPLVVERTMSWTREAYGAHGGGAVDGPQRRWYFAEGSQGFFDTYLLLSNPGAAAATVTVDFLRESGDKVTRTVTVPATSRYTIYAGSEPELVEQAFAIVVSSDEPVIAERAMYWSNGDTHWVGGHESAGVSELATEWFHAEGATGPYFETYLLVGNPNPDAAVVTVTYLLPSGAAIKRTYDVAGHARRTINVEYEDPMLADTAVSMTVRSTRPVVSERAMYWPGSPAQWQEAHNSAGLATTAPRWGLAEGCSGGTRRAQTYVLLSNATSSAATVRVTFLPETGNATSKTFTVGATSRFNVDVAYEMPGLAGTCFGVLIESTNGVPIAVERAMYWDARGTRWAAGTNAAAVPLP